MTEPHVVVVGGGAAGTAAALAARASGARVTVVLGRTGATALGSGAIDTDVDDAAKEVANALDLFAFDHALLATNAGTLRTASGRDRALCDLAAARGAVLVADVAHPSWDARALASAWSELDARGFVVRKIGLVTHTKERAMHHAELAALHDDAARLAIAATRIKEALAEGGTFGAVLLPPWLGVDVPRARALSDLVGVPCGEVLVSADGPAGARFEHARDRSLQNASIKIAKTRLKRVESGETCKLELEDDTVLEANAVVLATGGVLAGGIRYTPRGTSTFELAYDAPVVLGRRVAGKGHALVGAGSVYGVAPESITWPHANPPLLESVGVLVDARLRAHDRIFVCGDALEGLPRTMSSALSTGAAAGHASADATR